MATIFEDLFQRERALWQGPALQRIVDWGQSIMYGVIEDAFNDVWRNLVPAANKTFSSFLAHMQALVPESATSLYAMTGAVVQWMEEVMTENLSTFGEEVGAHLQRIVSETAGRFGEEAMAAAGKYVPFEVRSHLRFDAVNRDSVMWARQRSSQLIVSIDNNMRRTVQVLAANAQAGNLTTAQFARAVYDFIPLLPSHAGQVINNLNTNIAGGMKRELAERIARDHAARLRRYRANNIARTETITANNYGVDLWVRQKVDNGYLPGSAVRVWIATRDDRTCPRCKPMHGKTAPVDGAWRAPGPTARNDTVIIEYPPLHPSCRCAMAVYVPQMLSAAEIERAFAPILDT